MVSSCLATHQPLRVILCCLPREMEKWTEELNNQVDSFCSNLLNIATIVFCLWLPEYLYTGEPLCMQCNYQLPITATVLFWLSKGLCRYLFYLPTTANFIFPQGRCSREVVDGAVPISLALHFRPMDFSCFECKLEKFFNGYHCQPKIIFLNSNCITKLMVIS